MLDGLFFFQANLEDLGLGSLVHSELVFPHHSPSFALRVVHV